MTTESTSRRTRIHSRLDILVATLGFSAIEPRAFNTGSAACCSSAVSLIVNLVEVGAVHHANRDDREGKHLVPLLNVTGNHPVWRCDRHMGVDAAVDDISVHADEVRRLRWILHEGVLARHVAIGYCVDLISAQRSERGEDHAILDVLLLS